jgi:hypothetical protein
MSQPMLLPIGVLSTSDIISMDEVIASLVLYTFENGSLTWYVSTTSHSMARVTYICPQRWHYPFNDMLAYDARE